MSAIEASLGWAWVVGAIGGAINAALTSNLHWWPSFVATGPGRRIARPGLSINVAASGLSAVAVFAALALEGCVVDVRTMGPGMLVAVGIGLLGARCVTDAVDKRFLREAACRACAAPAAHPDTVRTIQTAAPYAVFIATDELIPRRVT